MELFVPDCPQFQNPVTSPDVPQEEIDRKCRACPEIIPTWIKIDGSWHNLSNRVFCLKCSPFGEHNTSPYGPRKLDREEEIFTVKPPAIEMDCVPCQDTRNKGEDAQLRVSLFATQKGYWVSKPTRDGCRYDLVIDNGNRLFRVQCKYAGVSKNGVVRVSLEKQSGSTKNAVARTYSASEIDAIVVYVAAIDKLLWLPPDLWDGKTAVLLRLTRTMNNQQKGIIRVSDYLWT